MNRVRSSFIGVGLLVMIFITIYLAVPASFAQEPQREVSDDEVNAIAKELYCPVCESTPLDVCPTQACADWREVIRTKLSEGQTAEQIEEYFAIQYGARALAEPPREGFTLAIWIAPIVVILTGLFFFGRFLRNINRGGTQELALSSSDPVLADSNMADPDQDDYVARIERELRERYP
jgi:cytochrome c-type biogenesis protein CcmH